MLLYSKNLQQIKVLIFQWLVNNSITQQLKQKFFKKANFKTQYNNSIVINNLMM